MILSSKTDIISMALVNLGQNPVGSLQEQSKGVISALAQYDLLRRTRLAYPWRFALREYNLTPLSASIDKANESDYDNAYALPADPAPVFIWGLADRRPFGLYGDQIHTDANPAKLIYVADLDAPKLFSPFAFAFALELSSLLAIPVTESTSKAQHFTMLARDAWKEARKKDSDQAWLVSIPMREVLYHWPTPRG